MNKVECARESGFGVVLFLRANVVILTIVERK